MDLTTRPDAPELIDIWQEALEAVLDLCTDLDEAQWRSWTPCPGWTVADIVAHIIDIEQFLLGTPRPDHEPAWERLPHATSDIGRLTEVGVDFRRGHTREAVLAELETVIPARRAQLEAVPEGGEVPSPLGRPSTVDRVLRTRIFDTWIHEHDIRSAISHDGGWGTRPAIITFQQISAGVPVMWAKRAAAPIGSTVAVHVTGPFISGTIHATVNAESRGELVPDASEPTVDVTLSWPDLMRLSTGRIDPDDPAVRRRLTLTGDPQLVDAFLHGMVLTP